MGKFVASFALILLSVSLSAQSLKIYKDGQVLQRILIAQIDSIIYTPEPNAKTQWTDEWMHEHLIAQAGEYGQCLLHTEMLRDGRLVATWLRQSAATNHQYHLYMQTFDAEGNALLGSDGAVVSARPTETWTSEYGLAQLSGDLVLAHTDCRYKDDDSHVYLYRCTPQGKHVWSAEGVPFPTVYLHAPGTEYASQSVVSGQHIYVSVCHYEYYREKATEDNWTPSPWIPDQEMPDSVNINYRDCRIMCYNADGEPQWDEPIYFASTNILLQAIGDGDVIVFHEGPERSLYAQRYDAKGRSVWAEPAVIDSTTLAMPNRNFPLPTVQQLSDGNLAVAYRKLCDYDAWAALNILTPDGHLLLDEAVSCNNITEGDSNYP